MSQPTAAVQLIVFGQRNRDDIAGVLKEVAAAGFPAIEAGNLYESYGEETAKRLLAENHLQVSGAHFGYGEYANEARLKAHFAYATAMGLKNLMCSGVADSKSAEGYRQSAKVFNSIGRQAVDAGMTFHYHNHAWEFDDLGGVNGMEILSSETDPALVKFNIDVFWVWYGGKDPAEFITRHAERAGYYHFKDGRRGAGADGRPRPEFLELGRGEVDLKAAMAAARQAGAQWIVAEQDSTTLPALESVTISRAYLRDVLGV
jgi:sugar phosphate isomerase/epimerase